MQGETERVCPRAYVRERHPDWEVVETSRLPAGVLGCVDHERRIIWLASGLSEAQQRCTLAYEIGQLQQGPTPRDPCLAAAHQRAAADWAAMLLIPSEDFAAAWGMYPDLPSMAASLGVDLPTFRARIRAASDADQDAAVEAMRQMRQSA